MPRGAKGPFDSNRTWNTPKANENSRFGSGSSRTRGARVAIGQITLDEARLARGLAALQRYCRAAHSRD